MNRMNKIYQSLAFILVGTLATVVAAPVDPVNSVLDRAMQTKKSDNRDSATFEDGGNLNLLKNTAKAVAFHVGVHSDVEYQSNADLDGNSGKGSAVWFPSTELGLRWKIAPKWSLDSTAGASAGLYSSAEEQNFWGVTSNTVLKYSLGRNLPFFYAGPDLYRYQSFDTGDEISRGVAPKAGMGYSYRIEKSKTNIFSDIRYQHHFVSPSDRNRDQDRDTVRVMLGLTQQIADNLFVQGYYEYRFSDYTSFGREDSRNTVGASLIWEATRNLSLRLNTSFIDNDSTDEIAQFQTINTGMGSSLIWRF